MAQRDDRYDVVGDPRFGFDLSFSIFLLLRSRAPDD